jgi:hypothetical protein
VHASTRSCRTESSKLPVSTQQQATGNGSKCCPGRMHIYCRFPGLSIFKSCCIDPCDFTSSCSPCTVSSSALACHHVHRLHSTCTTAVLIVAHSVTLHAYSVTLLAYGVTLLTKFVTDCSIATCNKTYPWMDEYRLTRPIAHHTTTCTESSAQRSSMDVVHTPCGKSVHRQHCTYSSLHAYVQHIATVPCMHIAAYSFNYSFNGTGC